ncbi:RHS repeat protein, partial [Methylobacillus arboreus]|uniref:RHS repeat domain-containing protein n=1 Tax=Methylobacillus arboreus TaxID=755170 RepID=UPI001E392F38
TQTIRYATQSPSAQWATGTLAQLKPATNATRDQTTYRLYNAQGQLVGEVDAESYLTEYQYDRAGNTETIIRYASKVTYAVGNPLAQIRPATHPEDLMVYTRYDANNRLELKQQKTLSQNGMQGLMTVYTRDNVGNLTSTTALDFSNFPPSDRTQSKRYDLQGRVIAELNGEGNKALQALGSSPTQAQIDNIWNNYGIRYEYDAA